MALAPALPDSDDVQLTAHQTRDRLITGAVTVAPVAGLGFVAWQVWGDWLHRGDLVVFAIFYLATGLGVTVGFHRHLTHRAFATTRPLRALLPAGRFSAPESAPNPLLLIFRQRRSPNQVSET